MFAFILFLAWVLSIVMMITAFHWGWMVAFFILTIYFAIRYTGGEAVSFLDFDFFDF